MNDRKFTDEEVMKALECCSSSNSSLACDGCPFDKGKFECIENDFGLLNQTLSLVKKQKEKIDALTCINTLQERDLADRDEMLRAKVEDVYADFMRDYRVMEKELESANKEIGELQAEVERERHLNDKRRMSYEDIVTYVAETFKKRAEKAICDHTYPDFNKDGKPVNVWKALEGFNALEEIKNQLLEEET